MARGFRLGPDADGPTPLTPLRYSPLTQDEVAAVLQPHGGIDLDDEARLAFHYACQVHNHDLPVATVMLADELHTRLEHLNLHIKSVAVLLREHSSRALLLISLLREQDLDKLRVLMYTQVDAFYYGAHRVQQILRSKKLPHVTGYLPVKAVVYLRDLIEHSFGKHYSHAAPWRAMVHPVNGPMLSAHSDATPGSPQHPHHASDLGMFITVKSFKAQLHPVLDRAVDAMGGKVPTADEWLREQKP